METGEGGELFRRHHISGMVLRDALLKRGWIHQIRQPQRRSGAGLLPS